MCVQSVMDDDFGSFATADASASASGDTPSFAAFGSFAGETAVPPAVTSQSASAFADFGDFGGFGGAGSSAVKTEGAATNSLANDFGSFGGNERPTTNNGLSAGGNDSSSFGDLSGFSMAPASSGLGNAGALGQVTSNVRSSWYCSAASLALLVWSSRLLGIADSLQCNSTLSV